MPETAGETELVRANGDRISTSPAYALYQAHPRALDSLVEQTADWFFSEPAPISLEALVAMVRPSELSAAEYQAEGHGLARPIAGSLIAVICVDTAEGTRFPNADKLRSELGMPDDGLWDRAHANLRDRANATPPKLEPGRLATITTGVGLAASLLSDDVFWRHPNLAAAGDLVVSAIELDQVIVARREEDELVRSMRRLAADYRSPDFLSDQLLLRRGGEWTVFV
ncbi:MAG: hypothetical protein ACREE0_16950 [Phenylobacterium sp.]